MNPAQKLMAGAGLAAVIAGSLLGLIPASITSTGDTNYTCGSPWIRDHSGEQSANTSQAIANALIGQSVYAVDYRAKCDDALGSRGVFGGVIAGFGVLALLGVGLIAAQQYGRRETAVDGADTPTEPAAGDKPTPRPSGNIWP